MGIKAVLFDLGDTLWHFPNMPPQEVVRAETVARIRRLLQRWGHSMDGDRYFLGRDIRLAVEEATERAFWGDLKSPDYPELCRQVAARHGLELTPGQLSREEIVKVVEAALEEGVRHVVVTHPDYPTQDLSPADQRHLADQGAHLERCFVPFYTGKVPWERLFAVLREVGVERSFLSTDLGQPQNPPVEEGLALFAEKLLEAGFSEEEVHHMAVAVPTLLAGGRE